MLNWLSTLFPRDMQRAPSEGLRPAPHIDSVALHNGLTWPDVISAQHQTSAYQHSPWVYVAVNRIAEAGALVPLRVMQRVGERTLEIVRHPLEDLLDAPNPTLSRFELIEQTLGHLELTGNAYWFLAGENGIPTEIWPLRPDRVTIVPDGATYVRGYLYEIDGQRIPLEAVEVVHFKRWHPANDYYGLSALEAARLAVSSDRAMAEWNRNTFGKDNGVPAGIVNIKEYVSDSDFERIKREWRASYGGPQRRTAFLRGGSIEWREIGLSHTDLDFLQGRKAHRDEILNIFGLPIGLVSENATEANAKVAERHFIERTLWPKLVRLSQKITQDLLPFWPGDFVAAFEDIRPTDAQARLEEIRASYPVLSINEIRERYYHLPPVEWGALPVGANAPLPVGTSAALPAEAPPAETEAAEAVTVEESPTVKAQLDELARWEKFTLKRLGRPQTRPFEVRTLPDDVAFEISAGLLVAVNPVDEAAVREVFASARESVLRGNEDRG